MPYQVLGKSKQTVCYSTGIHQVAGQDEKRDSEQGKTCCAGVHSRRNHAQDIDLTQPYKKDHCGQTHGDSNGKSNHDKKYQYPKDGSSHHGGCLYVTVYFIPYLPMNPLTPLLKKRGKGIRK